MKRAPTRSKKQYRLKPIACAYCGKKLSTENTHVDHVIPKKLGGGMVADNVLPICDKCNLHKNAKSPIKFIQELLAANGQTFKWNEIDPSANRAEVETVYLIGGDHKRDWYFYKENGDWFMRLSRNTRKSSHLLIDVDIRFLSIMLKMSPSEYQEFRQYLEDMSQKQFGGLNDSPL